MIGRPGDRADVSAAGGAAASKKEDRNGRRGIADAEGVRWVDLAGLRAGTVMAEREGR